MALDPILYLQLFWSGFVQWLSHLTLLDFFLIFWPLILIDLMRSVGKSVVLLLGAAYYRVRKPKTKLDFKPKISLIIPAHNEEKIIVRSIESALEADYPNKEIIVVDDGSKDATYQSAYPYAKRGLIKLIQRDSASGSKAGALNYGLLFATGEVVVTVDADTLIERQSLKELVKSLSVPNACAVSGNVRILRGERGGKNLLVRLQAYEYLLSLELGRRFNSMIGTLLIISGAFGAFWRKDVQSLGEYDTDTITEDFDLTIKMRKLGRRLFFSENAISWTFAPETWRDWRRQRMRWTRGQAETLWKHRNLFRRTGFDFRLVAAIYDMLFVDFIVLFVRFVWLFVVIFFYQPTLPYILLLSVFIYLLSEVFVVVTAGLLSPRKEDLKNVYLVPVIVLFYRPYYSAVRLAAYINWLLKRKSSW